MPVATPEIYAQMLDTAKEKAFAFPAINVSSSQTLNAALKGFADAGVRRDHPDLHRRRGVPLRPGGQEHGERLGRVRGVRRRGGQELPGQRRAAHRPLPEGQARRLRPAAARHQRRAGRPRRGAAVPVAHVGRVRRTAGREPRRSPRSCSPSARPPTSSSRSRSASSAARRTASRARSTRSSTRRPQDALDTVEALGLGDKGRYLTALTFGNVHGVYKPGNVKLRPEILKKAQDAIIEKYGTDAGFGPGSLPLDLVFHGGSGSSEQEIADAVDYGVVKMNVDTDTQYAFTRPGRRPHVPQLRRRAEGRRRGRQQEGLRPPRLGQGRRGRHGRPRRRGLRATSAPPATPSAEPATA